MSTIASQSIGKAVKLQQVLINILSNTIKFTKEGGKVAFSASQRRKTKNDAPSAGSFWYIGMSRMNFCRSGSGMCRSAGWPRQLRPHTRCWLRLTWHRILITWWNTSGFRWKHRSRRTALTIWLNLSWKQSIIAMTADAFAEDIKRTRLSGCLDFKRQNRWDEMMDISGPN